MYGSDPSNKLSQFHLLFIPLSTVASVAQSVKRESGNYRFRAAMGTKGHRTNTPRYDVTVCSQAGLAQTVRFAMSKDATRGDWNRCMLIKNNRKLVIVVRSWRCSTGYDAQRLLRYPECCNLHKKWHFVENKRPDARIFRFRVTYAFKGCH